MWRDKAVIYLVIRNWKKPIKNLYIMKDMRNRKAVNLIYLFYLRFLTGLSEVLQTKNEFATIESFI